MPTNTQKVIKGVSSNTIVTIVLGVVEIASFSIMSRLLSQKDFGYYAAIVAIATVFQSLADSEKYKLLQQNSGMTIMVYQKFLTSVEKQFLRYSISY